MDDNSIAADEHKASIHKSMYQGTTRIKFIQTSYYSSEAMLLLLCLTLSMLILPLILPPLPPPPHLLLLLPIAILGVLVLLAVAPSNVKEVSYGYV